VLVSLAQQLFAHETSTFNSGEDPFMTADMVLDALAHALGALDDQVQQAEAREARGGPVARSAQRHGPRLGGRIRRLPSGAAFAADLVTLGVFVAGAAKLIVDLTYWAGAPDGGVRDRSSRREGSASMIDGTG
jgi:hypothetical protein